MTVDVIIEHPRIVVRSLISADGCVKSSHDFCGPEYRNRSQKGLDSFEWVVVASRITS